MSEPRKYKGVYPAKGGGWWVLAPKVNGKFKGGKKHLGHFDTWTFGNLDIWTPGYLDTWNFGHLDTWTFGNLNI